jgi:hypothetical protein
LKTGASVSAEGIDVSRLVTVIVVHSLSYTGTTWLNAVLGSHPRAFALGPPKRAYDSRGRGWNDACLIHAGACPFWPRFHQRYDSKRNFFLQLAEASARDVIVINNPTADVVASELRHPDILVKPVNLIRDGRAIAASYLRHNGGSFFDAVTQFLYPAFHVFYFDPANTDTLCLRYEDVNREKRKALEALGAFIGLEYSPSALQFWRHEHHLTSGNHALVALITMGQGKPVLHLKEREFYEAEFQRMQQGEDAPFEDERWTDELTALDRFVFDLFCGVTNERFGYTRDRFTLSEIASFARELREAARAGAISRALLSAAVQEISDAERMAAGLEPAGWLRWSIAYRLGSRLRHTRAVRSALRLVPGTIKQAVRRVVARGSRLTS